MFASQLIDVERQRQFRKGFDSRSDEKYKNKELLTASSLIIMDVLSGDQDCVDEDDDPDGFPQKLALKVRNKYSINYQQRLVIAGAMLCAEIERIERMKTK